MSEPAAATLDTVHRRRSQRRRRCASAPLWMTLAGGFDIRPFSGGDRGAFHVSSALYVGGGERHLRATKELHMPVPLPLPVPVQVPMPLPVSPPPLQSSVANVGGTVPERVVVELESGSSGALGEDNAHSRFGGRHRHQRRDSWFWLDGLGPEDSALASDRWHRHQDSHEWHSYSQSHLNTGTPRWRSFSLLSWNILSQSLYGGGTSDSGSNEDDDPDAASTSGDIFPWEERLPRILRTIFEADADVVCLQEVECRETFLSDLLPAMRNYGYDGTVQGQGDCREIKRRSGKKERRHLVATFWKRRYFRPINVTDSGGVGFAHMARGRTLTCTLQDISGGVVGTGTDIDKDQDTNAARTLDGPILSVINCHLEGHPKQYAARMRQLQHAMEDLATRRTRGPEKLNGLVIAGDFNCELQSSACSTYLRIGRVGRKGGLGGIHGTSALAVPPLLLESEEAAQALSPILEWGQAIPNDDVENVKPHPFRRNAMASAYPPDLGRRDPRMHFTYCANEGRPVAGLDQIWHSGFTLTRVALRKMFATQKERKDILETGLPTPSYPSDHLPIGAVFDWNVCDPLAEECALDESCSSPLPLPHSSSTCAESGIRELFVTQDRVAPTPKPKSPVAAFAELDLLLSTIAYDSEEQRKELVSIVEHVPDLPTSNNKKPSKEQLAKLGEMRERKRMLLADASEPVRHMLQRVLKLSKETAGMY